MLPAFGQRGLTGRLRSRSKTDQEHSGLKADLSVEEQNQNLKRAQSKNVGTGLLANAVCPSPNASTDRLHSRASPLPHLDRVRP
ncbi:hypothetical protein DCC84_16970 [Pseudomonas sp. SXM-1]|nr:hypothetical protein DCC84_16970 [Pseudomonas sp. SXM-1]